MQINNLLFWAIKKTTALDAEVLLSHTLNKPKSFLYTYPEKKLTQAQVRKYKSLISRRAKHEPVAYITGHKEFYGLDFYVNQHTLIPRPETEALVEKIIKNKDIHSIADIGTGSGCIAIALAKNNPKLNIYAIDISSKALTVARKNAKAHKVKNITFKQGNLLEPIKNIKLDAIVANLPYLSEKVYKKNYQHLKYEPKQALYAGKDGLDYYKKLLKQINKLKHKPQLYIELI